MQRTWVTAAILVFAGVCWLGWESRTGERLWRETEKIAEQVLPGAAEMERMSPEQRIELRDELDRVISCGFLNMAREMVEYVPLDPTDDAGLLFSAVSAERNNYELCVLLMGRGLRDVTQTVEDDWSMLHRAAYEDLPRVAELLIEHGAEVNCRESFTLSTPLHTAADRGSWRAAKVLLENGADYTMRDKSGDTPMEVAKEPADPDRQSAWGKWKIARMLRLRMASGWERVMMISSRWAFIGVGVLGVVLAARWGVRQVRKSPVAVKGAAFAGVVDGVRGVFGVEVPEGVEEIAVRTGAWQDNSCYVYFEFPAEALGQVKTDAIAWREIPERYRKAAHLRADSEDPDERYWQPVMSAVRTRAWRFADDFSMDSEDGVWAQWFYCDDSHEGDGRRFLLISAERNGVHGCYLSEQDISGCEGAGSLQAAVPGGRPVRVRRAGS